MNVLDIYSEPLRCSFPKLRLSLQLISPQRRMERLFVEAKLYGRWSLAKSNFFRGVQKVLLLAKSLVWVPRGNLVGLYSSIISLFDCAIFCRSFCMFRNLNEYPMNIEHSNSKWFISCTIKAKVAACAQASGPCAAHLSGRKPTKDLQLLDDN